LVANNRSMNAVKILMVVSGALAIALAGIHFVRSGVHAPSVERLWEDDAPQSVGKSDADVPSISVFLPPEWHAAGAGIVICPGGAYKLLMSSYEGDDIARWLNSFGVAGFVLKYRIAPRYRYPAPALDAQRAIRYVRHHAARFGIRPDRVGIIGFSAGGHLASTVLTHFDRGAPGSADPVERESSRPDFGILAYPIITLRAPWTHAESVENLLGPNPDHALIDDLSNELHVTSATPPTFLFHTGEDSAVPPENSILFYSALRRAGVPAEIHVFPHGPHGVGLANGHGKAPRVPSLLGWPLSAEAWLTEQWTPQRRWSFSRLFRL
jgi:acetyl esterase/lipase